MRRKEHEGRKEGSKQSNKKKKTHTKGTNREKKDEMQNNVSKPEEKL